MVTDLADQRAETCVGSGGRPGAGLNLYRIFKKFTRVFVEGPSEYESGGSTETGLIKGLFKK